jgi:transposase
MQNVEIFIGLDMGKFSFSAAIVTESNPSIYEEQFSNDKAGYAKLLKWVNTVYPGRSRQVLICLEHTGMYSRGVSLFLSQKNMQYTLLSGLHLKRSLGIRRGKTDRADARDIAKFGLTHKNELRHTVLPEAALLKLKDKLSERNRMVKVKQMLLAPARERKAVGLKTTKSEERYTQSLVESLRK